MAERLKDAEDLALEALFRSEPLPDDGFSAGIVGRLRRRIWARRLTLPVAVVAGATIAAEPVVALLDSAAGLLTTTVPGSALSADWVPSSMTLMAGALLFGVMFAALNFLEE